MPLLSQMPCLCTIQPLKSGHLTNQDTFFYPRLERLQLYIHLALNCHPSHRDNRALHNGESPMINRVINVHVYLYNSIVVLYWISHLLRHILFTSATLLVCCSLNSAILHKVCVDLSCLGSSVGRGSVYIQGLI